MAYMYRCTAKRAVCSGKVPKGVTVQVVKSLCAMPTTTEIRTALKQQLGIETKDTFSPSSDFICELIK